MRLKSSVFDPSGLKTAEEAYRFVLRQEPDNMDIRVDLAWCLLLQALYLSGQETAVAAQNIPEDGAFSQAVVSDAAPAPDAVHLLQECLRHSLTVKHLSAHTANQIEVEKLVSLVLLAGGKEHILFNEERGARIKSEIFRALWQPYDHDSTEAS